MPLLGRIVWAVQVWLTAVTTLIAGIPHFDCRCPDGHVKPLCLAVTAEASGCCCGGSCCSAPATDSHSRGPAQAGRARKKSCCARPQHDGLTSAPGNDGGALSGTGCVRTGQRSDAAALAPNTAAGRPDVTARATPFALTPVVPTSALPRAAFAAARGAAHSLSPPPDLLSLLQHLLI
jgi:hypothetical protein